MPPMQPGCNVRSNVETDKMGRNCVLVETCVVVVTKRMAAEQNLALSSPALAETEIMETMGCFSAPAGPLAPRALLRAPTCRPLASSWRLHPQHPALRCAYSAEDGSHQPSTSAPRQDSAEGSAVAVAGRSGRTAVLKAQKFGSIPVQERGRPLGENMQWEVTCGFHPSWEASFVAGTCTSASRLPPPPLPPAADYMTLPASQYSVLDAKRIERLDADTFRCYVSGLQFLNFHVEPVLTLNVLVGEAGPTVRLLDTTLQGSKAVQAANDRFTATMTNVVRWQAAAGGGKEIVSDTSIQVTLDVPPWFVLPTRVIESAGEAQVQGGLCGERLRARPSVASA